MSNKYGRPINNIIIHCTASTQEASVESILNYWSNALGWKSPGYHYLVDPTGKTHVLAQLNQVTNGVRGYNWNSVHISYIGGKYGIDNRTNAQKIEMERILKNLIKPFYLGPEVHVAGHRDFSPDKNNDGIVSSDEWLKLCPSFDVSQWLKDINLEMYA
jgi:N-acetylmuramoyl-L-alanine amidase